MRIHQILLGFTLLPLPGQLTGQPTELPDYKNPDKGVEERVEDLLTRITREENISQMKSRTPVDLNRLLNH